MTDMTERIFTLIKLRHAARSVGSDKQHLPAVEQRLNNVGVLGASFSVSDVHGQQCNTILNECKG